MSAAFSTILVLCSILVISVQPMCYPGIKAQIYDKSDCIGVNTYQTKIINDELALANYPDKVKDSACVANKISYDQYKSILVTCTKESISLQYFKNHDCNGDFST